MEKKTTGKKENGKLDKKSKKDNPNKYNTENIKDVK